MSAFSNSAADFFNDDMGAELFEVTPPAGAARNQLGIFMNENSPIDTGGGIVMSDSPMVDFLTSTTTGMVKKTKVKRLSTNVNYYVLDPGIDDEGITTMTLSKTIPQ